MKSRKVETMLIVNKTQNHVSGWSQNGADHVTRHSTVWKSVTLFGRSRNIGSSHACCGDCTYLI